MWFSFSTQGLWLRHSVGKWHTSFIRSGGSGPHRAKSIYHSHFTHFLMQAHSRTHTHLPIDIGLYMANTQIAYYTSISEWEYTSRYISSQPHHFSHGAIPFDNHCLCCIRGNWKKYLYVCPYRDSVSAIFTPIPESISPFSYSVFKVRLYGHIIMCPWTLEIHSITL